ncbi:unnamed protein product [Ilex paraguariensis]|uniref:Uncharacterized protein n=1 Tax=Ilex paraguariensis TaxID=185542 RepID=A0ABC8TT77_9AQUA
MKGFLPLKLKRKDLEEINDDFSDFSLSSPARKIRRLDAELPLPPIMEEEELEIPPAYGQQTIPTSNVGPVIEELPTVPVNEERSIVLFKPMNSPLLQLPSTFSVSVDPDLISGFKNADQVLWSSKSSPLKSAEDDVVKQDLNSVATNDLLAVVPWVPSPFPTTSEAQVFQTDASDLMEAEVIEASAMDVEDKNVGVDQRPGNEFGGISEGLHPWQQQHCMIPQPPQNASTPLVWYR